LKKIISIIITTLAILIFLFAIGIMFIGTNAMRKNEPLYIFGYSFSIVPTNSMIGDAPDSLDVYDIAIIKKSSFDQIEIGDVIVFQGEIQGIEVLVIHRVVGLHHEGGYETKGDNNISVDVKPVTEDNYQGSFHGKITFLKPIARLAANSRDIIFIGLSIILVAMVLTETIHIIKTIKHDKEEKLKKDFDENIENIKALEKQKLYEEILKEEQEKMKSKPVDFVDKK
jgi:signal peptidase I